MTATRILVAIAAVAALGFYVGPYRDKQQDEERLATGDRWVESG